MLIVNREEGESIDKLLKKYKAKHNKSNIIKILKDRKEFIKSSVKKRTVKNKAIYKQTLYQNN